MALFPLMAGSWTPAGSWELPGSCCFVSAALLQLDEEGVAVAAVAAAVHPAAAQEPRETVATGAQIRYDQSLGRCPPAPSCPAVQHLARLLLASPVAVAQAAQEEEEELC